MLEIMDYLRANGFRTYIMTGGGQEFVRVYSTHRYEVRDGKPVLMREPKIFFIDDHAGKAIGINLFIGKRPYAAFGNSIGDREMLEWTGAGDGTRLMMLVLHTMTPNASTPTAPQMACRTPRSAHSPSR